MSPRLSAQATKSIADVVRRRARSILIVAAILISVGGLTAASVADDALSAAYAFSLGIGGPRPDVTIVADKTTPAMLTAGRPNLHLAQVQDWRKACNGLVRSFDNVMHGRLLSVTGAAPW